MAHFSISGEAFTDIARNIMLSDMPAKAWRLVVDGLIGAVGADRQARELLDGRLKLVGDSSGDGLSFVKDDDAERYLRDLKHVYAGRVRIDKSWWRPRAKVLDFGPGDMRFAMSPALTAPHVDEGGATRMKAIYRGRVAYYAKEGERVCEAGGEYLIFEPVAEPPFWWDEHADPEAALQDFLAADRHLDQERWSDTVEAQLAAALRTEGGRERPETAEEREAREALEEERWALRDLETARRHKEIGDQVRAKAAGAIIFLKLDDGRVVNIPEPPFIAWALGRTSLRHLAPAWTPVSPSGMKLQMDDPCHTDWMLGAGLDLQKDYGHDREVQKKATRLMFELQERYGNFQCGVLVSGHGGVIDGVVGGEIIVLPNLSPKHLDKLKYARCIITEEGGALAHLAQVALERMVPVLLVKDARKRYPAGRRLTVDVDLGKIVDHYAL